MKTSLYVYDATAVDHRDVRMSFHTYLRGGAIHKTANTKVTREHWDRSVRQSVLKQADAGRIKLSLS